MTVDPREFEALEEETDAFDIRVDGVPVWERIRFGVYRSLQEQDGMGQAHSTIGGGGRDYVKGVSNWLKNWVHRNPYLADPADVMFVGHPRRKLLEDGLWWDIYCDPIHEACDLDSVHFEPPYLLNHRQPTKTEGIRYLDLIKYGGTLQQKLGLHRVSIPEVDTLRLDEIECEIDVRFDASVDLKSRTIKSLRRRRSELWLWERLLVRVSPQVVVLIVGYGKEPLIEACQRSGVPVVELQHGAIYRGHMAYHYPANRTKETFPDYMFVWGEHWKGCVNYPIGDDRIVVTGYPFLESQLEKYSSIGKDNGLLFISQGTIGAELSEFAVRFAKLTGRDDIVYKLHPGEYDRWEKMYPWLKKSNIRVIDDESIPLYRLFAENSIQVGVYSTALLEGLAFDLDTYLVDLPGLESLQYLSENDLATVVDDSEDLADLLTDSQIRRSVRTDRIFEQDATIKVRDALHGIADIPQSSPVKLQRKRY